MISWPFQTIRRRIVLSSGANRSILRRMISNPSSAVSNRSVACGSSRASCLIFFSPRLEGAATPLLNVNFGGAGRRPHFSQIRLWIARKGTR